MTNAVRGPMYIEATPLMVTADVEPLVRANVAEVLELLCEEFFDDLVEAATATPTGQHDGHAPDALRFERLAEQLLDRMTTKVALTGTQAVRVAGQMHALGRPRARVEEHVRAVVAQSEATRIEAARRHG